MTSKEIAAEALTFVPISQLLHVEFNFQDLYFIRWLTPAVRTQKGQDDSMPL